MCFVIGSSDEGDSPDPPESERDVETDIHDADKYTKEPDGTRPPVIKINDWNIYDQDSEYDKGEEVDKLSVS